MSAGGNKGALSRVGRPSEIREREREREETILWSCKNPGCPEREGWQEQSVEAKAEPAVREQAFGSIGKVETDQGAAVGK